MIWQHRYAPLIWPMLASAAFGAMLAVFGWRRRRTPGAKAFVVLMFSGSAWGLASALGFSAVDEAGKAFWFQVEALFAAICAVPSLCFALEFAYPGRWVTRRNVALIAVVPAVFVLLTITNDAHHLIWTRIWFDGFVRAAPGPAYPFTSAYLFLLPLLNTAIFLWLFVRSSGVYRWQAGLVLLGGLAPRLGVLCDILNVNPLAPLDPTILGLDVMGSIYTIALFRFGMFEIVPVAHNTLLGLMREGMLVLDSQDRVVDVNRAAMHLLRSDARACIGRPATEVLAAVPALAALLGQPGQRHAEVAAGTDAARLSYEVIISPLMHERGWQLGRLILLYDITERKRAEEQLVEQHRAMATTQERERVARELHDGLGQVVGYVKLQAQAARSLVAQGRNEEAERFLEQLVAVAQEAHTDVREYILEASTASPLELGFGASLREYLHGFSLNHQIQTELVMPPELKDGCFEPAAAVQLLRIIQEALSNARKHSHAAHVRVSLAARDGAAEVMIADDGRGFTPGPSGSSGFGLRFMAERAAQVGGTCRVSSASGQGTQVVVCIPLRKEGR